MLAGKRATERWDAHTHTDILAHMKSPPANAHSIQNSLSLSSASTGLTKIHKEGQKAERKETKKTNSPSTAGSLLLGNFKLIHTAGTHCITVIDTLIKSHSSREDRDLTDRRV